MTYGLRPWDIDALTRREWHQICDYEVKRSREVTDGP